MGFFGGHFTSDATSYYPWKQNFYYNLQETVIYGKMLYTCIVAHQSGTYFEADAALGYWQIANLPQNGRNYAIVGNSFEDGDVGGWQLFNISGYSAGTFPVSAPTIGSASSMTLATTATTPISGTYSLQVSNVASTNFAAGHGIISQAYNIDRIDRYKPLAFKHAYEAITGSAYQNYSGTSSNTWATYFYCYDSVAASWSWVQPSGVYNYIQSSGVGLAYGTLAQPSTNITQIRYAVLCVNPTTGSSPAVNTIQTNFDEFYLGPQITTVSPSMSIWKSYTPTWLGSTTNPSIGNGTITGQWRQVGDTMDVTIDILAGSTTSGGSGTYSWSIPSGFTIDTTKIVAANQTIAGIAKWYQSSGTLNNLNIGSVQYASTTTVNVFTGSPATGPNNWGSAAPYNAVNSTTMISIQFSVPIVGWSTNTISSADFDGRILAACGYGGSNLNYTSGAMTYTAATFDETGCLDIATGRFTANSTGKYVLVVNGLARSSGTGNSAVVYKNGASFNGNTLFSYTTAGFAFSASIVVNMVAKDYLDLRNDGAINYLNAGYSVSFFKLQGSPIVQASDFIAPTIQKFTSGSGTYNLPQSPRLPKYIKIKMIGGGGGGSGGGITPLPATATAGGNTTFGSSLLTANGGAAGYEGITASGGSYTINSPAIGQGFIGSPGGAFSFVGNGSLGGSPGPGGVGGSSPFGGAGSSASDRAGQAATANTGSGGGGGSASTGAGTGSRSGGGGCAGGYIEAIINNPSLTYAYSVGTGGSGGTAGTSGYTGGAGAAGIIIVEEYYQ